MFGYHSHVQTRIHKIMGSRNGEGMVQKSKGQRDTNKNNKKETQVIAYH